MSQKHDDEIILLINKVAATDLRYFTTSKFSRSLVHKKYFSLISPVVFKLGYVFCKERWDTSFEFE